MLTKEDGIMESIINLRETCDDFAVEFEVLPALDLKVITDERRKEILENLVSLDAIIAENRKSIDLMNEDIQKLTNSADGFDYMVSVASGVITGLIDSFFVGEFDFKKAKEKSNKQVNNMVMKYAKLRGYKGDRLAGAVDFLEKKFPVAQDNIWSGKGIGVGTKNHHLADLAHHPTLLGLAAAIAVQFFRMGIFVNRDGQWHFEFVDTDPKELLKIWMPVIISGLLNWLVYMVEAHYEDKMDEEIPKPIHTIVKMLANAPMAIEILKVADNWVGHLFSDMGGSKSTAGGGMGIPGLFISLLQEIAGLPFLKDTGLPQLVNDLYVKQKIDMRAELAVLNELGRQAVPVIIGEILVRGFYFVRHLINEIKIHESLRDICWNNVIPFGNRTIARMMTISSGTFMAVDLADAAIRSATNSMSVTLPTFFANMALRVNFVGVGRFAVAVGTDVGMGIKRSKLRNERIKLYNEQIFLCDAKVFYKQADMWISAESAEKTIEEAYGMMEKTTVVLVESMQEIESNMKKISEYIPEIEKKNKGLLDEMDDILTWG